MPKKRQKKQVAPKARTQGQAKKQTTKKTQGQATEKTREQARKQAGAQVREQARKQAEEQARKQARKQAEEQVREQARKQAERAARAQARTEVLAQTRAQVRASTPNRNGVPPRPPTGNIFDIGESIVGPLLLSAIYGGIVCMLCYLTWGIMGTLLAKMVGQFVSDVGVGFIAGIGAKIGISTGLASGLFIGIPALFFGYQLIYAIANNQLGISVGNDFPSLLNGAGYVLPYASFAISMMMGVGMAPALWVTFGMATVAGTLMSEAVQMDFLPWVIRFATGANVPPQNPDQGTNSNNNPNNTPSNDPNSNPENGQQNNPADDEDSSEENEAQNDAEEGSQPLLTSYRNARKGRSLREEATPAPKNKDQNTQEMGRTREYHGRAAKQGARYK